MSAFIRTTGQAKFTANSDAGKLATGLYTLVQKHHAAILHLLGSGQFDASAFALAHPLVDAVRKAQWIICCATPLTIRRISRGVHCYPNMEVMTEEVESAIYEKTNLISLTPGINALRSSAHGLEEQLGLLFAREGDIGHSYSNLEKSELVTSATAQLTLLSLTWCQLTSKTPDEAERCTGLIIAKHAQIFAQRVS